MIFRRVPVIVTAVFIVAAVISCSKKETDTNDIGTETMTDSQLIQAAFNEAATRWHYGDKAALYDMEFEYYRAQYSYDDYLVHPTISKLSADSLDSIVVTGIQQFGDDSAYVDAVAVFTGPAGVKSRFDEGIPYRFYKRDGRWFHPTLSNIDEQLEFDQLKRAADSAAEAESDIEDDQ